MNKKNLKSLEYGRPTANHLKKMKADTSLVDASAESINLTRPPKKDSQEAASEIFLIKQALRDNGYKTKRMIDFADSDPAGLFISFAVNNGLRYDEEYIREISNQIKPLILQLKYHFNRPRPYQLANELEIEFNPVDKKSASTPSYPSGHAAQAYTISNIMSRENPGFERELENIADKIALTRFQAGVHYPSDISAGKELANILDSSIAGIEKYRGIIMEHDFRSITRSFLNESYQEGNPEKLRVLDFDDTIASTVERVRIETPEDHKMITSSEFATYEFEPGEYIDKEVAFSEFDRVDVDQAAPIPFVSDLLKKFAGPAGTSKLLILTARGPDVEPFVMDFLETKLGISNPSERVDFVGVGSKLPEDKVRVIQSYLDDHPAIEFVSFYDDSGKNVKAVKEFISARGIRGDIRQVIEDEDGTVRLISPDNISESISFRSMTRSFLMSIV